MKTCPLCKAGPTWFVDFITSCQILVPGTHQKHTDARQLVPQEAVLILAYAALIPTTINPPIENLPAIHSMIEAHIVAIRCHNARLKLAEG